MLLSVPHRLVFAAMTCLSLAACSGDKMEQASAPREVQVLALQMQAVALQQELPGRTVASEESDVRPQVSGVLLRRLFEEGAMVRAGQPLFQVEPALYQAAANEAQANQRTAEATAAAARLRAGRLQALGKEQLASQQEVDDAIATARQADASVDAAAAALDTARTTLRFASVTAPIAGRIGRARFTPGALVTSGQAEPLARIQRLDPMNVDITQSSSEFLALRRAIAAGGVQASSTPVTLKLSDGTDYAVPGTLEFADLDVDPATGSITLRATFPNPDGQLLPGMYVRARVGQGTRQQALLVPQSAVDRSARGDAQAWVIDNEGLARLREFSTVRAVGDQWLVRDGLQAGERVVTGGRQGLTDGAKVSIKDASAPRPQG
ncbi:efflux RND transporter periplasmic adaptor subunit [Stenotrophomonas tumulicola]|uniref:Efflux RND transporter periplasmic adaptor subunit n=1 Tax=Stenotrophomonas tumulicola TaxID=1685415 RepID=A0A7W3IHE5_9GAMM|nr:efflux RND transporter periplasmic adaptor subunit [Stenotrophomonas tumulicola]MBA8681935.1 efflux RND transporter periplasmic adaptor subunit [Stenotrophomonas tumulicola]